ncbi:hypothetical protein E1N52_29185 [Paraburkholderia guartelaensis]|uniref:Uncharacterized protein n=1 Tax=Paraburkholderia guartelaensis TaxID=2546446 RepID=A0A4R5L971_9BURK|nr:hypothetical protein [Paraburkholderia guartelaensis]TDG04524.1 hypothetical protein E1N52_29185 [Paraburkholderia guartelaensis]
MLRAMMGHNSHTLTMYYLGRSGIRTEIAQYLWDASIALADEPGESWSEGAITMPFDDCAPNAPGLQASHSPRSVETGICIARARDCQTMQCLDASPVGHAHLREFHKVSIGRETTPEIQRLSRVWNDLDQRDALTAHLSALDAQLAS